MCGAVASYCVDLAIQKAINCNCARKNWDVLGNSTAQRGIPPFEVRLYEVRRAAHEAGSGRRTVQEIMAGRHLELIDSESAEVEVQEWKCRSESHHDFSELACMVAALTRDRGLQRRKEPRFAQQKELSRFPLPYQGSPGARRKHFGRSIKVFYIRVDSFLIIRRDLVSEQIYHRFRHSSSRRKELNNIGAPHAQNLHVRTPAAYLL